MRKLALPYNRVFRLGPVAFALDRGEALKAGWPMFHTNLEALCFHNGRLEDRIDLGSGVITIGLVNAIVTDVVNATANGLPKYIHYHDSGTGTAAATDGDTALQTQAGPATRATGTLTNNQTATTGNHTAIVKSAGTINYTTSLAITEWGCFDQAAQGGNLGDHRVFSAINVANGDSITFNYSLSLPSNN